MSHTTELTPSAGEYERRESNEAISANHLAKYDAACRAVAEAKSVDEVKELRDQAEAMRAYARQAKNKQLEIDASEIRFRAERRIGELMAAQRQTVGLAPAGRPKEIGSQTDPIIRPPTLADAGIDKHLADRARKYAAVPADEFEATLADRRQRIETENRRVTLDLMASGERHAAREPEPEQMRLGERMPEEIIGADAVRRLALEGWEIVRMKVAAAVAPGDFSDVWAVWPNKVAKPAAEKAYIAARKRGVTHQRILAGIQRYIAEKPADRPWLHFATFCNQERFNDQPAAVSAPLRGSDLVKAKIQQEILDAGYGR